MPVNQTLASLSQTPASNGPLGSDPPSSLDDSIRFGLSFIAQLRDGNGFSANAITSALGFTPIQQGTGTGQTQNAVKIGWDNTFLRVQVDSTNFGTTWPINIGGNAATATNATNAASATTAGSAGSATTAGTANFANNAGAVGGLALSGLVRNGSPGNVISLAWDGVRMNGGVDNINVPFRTTWANVEDRPTDLGAFSNTPGYVLRYGNSLVDVGAPDNSGVIGRAIPNLDARLRYINAITGGLGVVVDGAAYSWAINASDERLKENIRPTTEDSTAKIRAIDFKAFNFKDSVPLFAGISRKSGVIAQQIETIDPDWVTNAGDYKQLNLETIVTSLAHALQQSILRIDELERKT